MQKNLSRVDFIEKMVTVDGKKRHPSRVSFDLEMMQSSWHVVGEIQPLLIICC